MSDAINRGTDPSAGQQTQGPLLAWSDPPKTSSLSTQISKSTGNTQPSYCAFCSLILFSAAKIFHSFIYTSNIHHLSTIHHQQPTQWQALEQKDEEDGRSCLTIE